MNYLDALDEVVHLAAVGQEAQAIEALQRLESRANREHYAFHRQLLKILDRVAQGDAQIPADSAVLEELLKSVQPGQVSERLVRFFTHVHDYSESFRECMIQRSGAVRRQRFAPERILGREKYRKIFADAAKIEIPKIYQFGVHKDALKPRDLAVVKPLGLSGSRGINIIEKVAEGYLNRVDQSVHSTWQDFTSSLQVENTGHKTWDGRWVAEELIESPFPGEYGARDIKIYAFYGQIALVLEMSRWGDEKRYTWYNRDLEPVDTGIYPDAPRTRPLGLTTNNFNSSEAERISSLIPVPFVRLDFLLSADGSLVLGELSFRPGGFHRFSPKTDRKLGSMYKIAEARLLDDLVAGYTFPEYEITRLASQKAAGADL